MSHRDRCMAGPNTPCTLVASVLLNGRNETGWLSCQAARHKQRDPADVHLLRMRHTCRQNALREYTCGLNLLPSALTVCPQLPLKSETAHQANGLQLCEGSCSHFSALYQQLHHLPETGGSKYFKTNTCFKNNTGVCVLVHVTGLDYVLVTAASVSNHGMCDSAAGCRHSRARCQLSHALSVPAAVRLPAAPLPCTRSNSPVIPHSEVTRNIPFDARARPDRRRSKTL